MLGKTLGVPLFQEQAMRIAIVAAGFTPAEADRLRRAMATFRHSGTIHRFREKFIDGMVANGYERDFAERCFQQIEGFGEYGFPESTPRASRCSSMSRPGSNATIPASSPPRSLNSQPMGFYAPAQIVRDAREHGVEVRPADVNDSDWDCTLEAKPFAAGEGRVRPHDPLRRGEGASRSASACARSRALPRRMPRISSRRATKPYRTPGESCGGAGLKRGALERLAEADAFRSLGLDRRQALWAVKGLGRRAAAALRRARGRRGARGGAAGDGPGRACGRGLRDDAACR